MDISSSDGSVSTTSKTKLCKKLKCPSTLLEQIKDFPDVLDYIMSLQKYLEKQKKKLRKLKDKLKNKKDVSTQTEEYKALAEEVDETNSTKPKTLAEEITEAAEIATQQSGFVYEQTSGMYYDYNSGYYYNAEYGLYYDGNSGTYMKYNQDTQAYEFHSQVAVAPIATKPKVKTKRKKKLQESEQALKRECTETMPDILEEGECSDSSSQDAEHVENNSDEDSTGAGSPWPPCMRIIVKKTSVTGFKEGTLHIITYEGGSLGREGKHSVLIPDINVSKHHLKFTFDVDKGQFFVTDLGSKNGTILNGKRMSASMQESDPLEVAHGSQLQIGSTVLLCHVHSGNQTCGHCEPGLIESSTKSIDKLSHNSKSEQHKKELNNLRKKFGINSHEERSGNLAPGYTDRAQVRRETVGSLNHNEKTEVASIDQSISSENKGFKMLAKMGWSEGQSLGKDGQGLVEPINLVSNEGTAGIGSTNLGVSNINKVSSKKKEMWEKAQSRYQNLPELKSDDSENSE